MQTTKILPLGSFLTTENSGVFLPIGNKDKIQSPRKEALNQLTQELIVHVGEENLLSLYVRGSVAKGEAIEGVSDLDCFVLVMDLSHMEDNERKQAVKSKIIADFPVITDIELSYTVPENITKGKSYWWRFTLKTQSAHIYGKDIARDFENFSPTKELADKIKDNLPMRYEWAKEKMKKFEGNDEKIRETCVWIMKRILRMGGVMLMEQSKKFSRDLYPNYQLFSEYYPEKEEEIYKVLELAINPTTDPQAIIDIMDSFGKWIHEESVKKLT